MRRRLIDLIIFYLQKKDREMKKLTIPTLVILIVFCLFVTLSISADKRKLATQPATQKQMLTPQTQINAGSVAAKIPKIADLKVDTIHSYNCGCELEGVDAFYMANIMVDVANASGVPTSSTLTLTYHDLVAGPQTVIKSISTLNSYPTNPWALQRFVVVNHPVLVKKSTGIRAEIQPTPPTTESNPVNNVKIVNRCDIMVY